MITGVFGMAHHSSGPRVHTVVMQLAALLSSAILLFQAAPAATTGGSESVTTGSAVVTGTVNPSGEATTYQFEYGTSTSYGLTTPQQDAGAGSADVAARATLTSLTNNTTYHYRVVATNASGVTRGADRTLRTSAPAAAPSISSRAATGVTGAGATLNASVNPRSLATDVYFEYGTSTSYGTRTPTVAIGSSSAAVTTSAPIAGLRANTRYNFRAVATSAAGVTRGGNRTFTTGRVPTGVAITPSTVKPTWGSGLTITGTVSGSGTTPVALEKLDYPFTGQWVPLATATTNSSGAFNVTVPPLFATTRVRVATRTSTVVVSSVSHISVAVKVGLKTKRLSRRSTRIEGTAWPAVPTGRASLQRQSRSGRWIPVKRASLTPQSGDRARYRFTVVRSRTRAMNYRVVVNPRNNGLQVSGFSRVINLKKR
jgi:hypothetical protein